MKNPHLVLFPQKRPFSFVAHPFPIASHFRMR